jgi:hypothetical protein
MTGTLEQFHAATLVLVGAGPVKQRLGEAYRTHLASIREQDAPEQIRAPLTALRAAMHGASATGGLSAQEVAVRKMSESDAAGHAAAILDMLGTLSMLAAQDAVPRLRIVGAMDDDESDVPAFLSRA